MIGFFGTQRYLGLQRDALLSPCQKYRYWLKRSWQQGGDGRTLCFIMLNPSTADATLDDPTIRRCLAYTQEWGFSTLEVRNLFAYRSSQPKDLFKAADPVGPQGDYYLLQAREADQIIVAWGANVPFERDREVLKMFKGVASLYCLGATKHGQPRHPLYCRADLVPQLYQK